MNGFRMNMKDKSYEDDHHTFLAPSNIVIPDSVGKDIFHFIFHFIFI